jgi:hypothetical protein
LANKGFPRAELLMMEICPMSKSWYLDNHVSYHKYGLGYYYQIPIVIRNGKGKKNKKKI